MSAFEIGGSFAGVVVAVGRRSKATLKQSSRARHWSGWEELGWDRIQARRRKPEEEARRVAATCSGVVWPWLRRAASEIDWFKTVAASGVRVCWIVLRPALIVLVRPLCVLSLSLSLSSFFNYV